MASDAAYISSQLEEQFVPVPLTKMARKKVSRKKAAQEQSTLSIEALPDIWRDEFARLEEELREEYEPQTTAENMFFFDFAIARFLYTKAVIREVATFSRLFARHGDGLTDPEHALARRYSLELDRRANKALQRLQEHQVNRELAQECQAVAEDEIRTEIHVPVAAPMTKLLEPKQTKRSVFMVALRRAVAVHEENRQIRSQQRRERRKLQNEPNSASSPPPPDTAECAAHPK